MTLHVVTGEGRGRVEGGNEMNFAARKRRGLVKARGRGRPYQIGTGTANTGQVPSVTVNRCL